MNNFMTVQDCAPFVDDSRLQDPLMSASIRVFLLFAPFVEAQFYVFKFSRYTSRRGSYRSAQLSNCAGFGLHWFLVIIVNFSFFSLIYRCPLVIF